MNNKRTPHQPDALNLCILEPGRKAKQACPKGAVVAEIGNHIKFKLDVLDTYDYDGWKPIHYDLLVLSAAIEFADRRRARGISGCSRHFYLTIPVFELAAWQKSSVKQSLRAALDYLTGDKWEFNFVQWQGDPVGGNRQCCLPFEPNKQFVIAYSDGLDSRCVSALCETDDNAIRVRVAKKKDKKKKGDQPFDQIPFSVKVPAPRESSVRSRGFKFAVITAIAAQVSRVNRIVVPESGQGALGPALLPLHNVYPDYRNHPTYFRKIEAFIQALLGFSVRYEQPRLWQTKGQTIAAFLKKTVAPQEELIDTRSCWQQRWNANVGGKRRQCGLCAACLLRRMSMHAAGVDEDAAEQYVISDLSVAEFAEALPKSNTVRQNRNMAEYGSVGARHLQQLADMAERSDDALREEAFYLGRATDTTTEDALNNLKSMLATHAQEWHAFIKDQGEKSFLRSWIEGGRYGRSK